MPTARNRNKGGRPNAGCIRIRIRARAISNLFLQGPLTNMELRGLVRDVHGAHLLQPVYTSTDKILSSVEEATNHVLLPGWRAGTTSQEAFRGAVLPSPAATFFG